MPFSRSIERTGLKGTIMAQEREEKRLGRPPKAPTPGQRVSLGLKVTPDIKQRLDKDARKSGRTQSQQAELMIERAYQFEERFGGPAMLPVIEMLIGAFLNGGQRCAAASGHPEWTPAEWLDDQICYRTAAHAVGQALGLPLPGKAEMSDPAAVREVLTAMLAAGAPFTISEGQDK
jgi:hypothetical protein